MCVHLNKFSFFKKKFVSNYLLINSNIHISQKKAQKKEKNMLCTTGEIGRNLQKKNPKFREKWNFRSRKWKAALINLIIYKNSKSNALMSYISLSWITRNFFFYICLLDAINIINTLHLLLRPFPILLNIFSWWVPRILVRRMVPIP